MAGLRRLSRDRSGSFAVVAAFAAVPLVFIVGGVIDLSRAYGAKLRLQSATDAAALAVIKSSGFDQKRARDIAIAMIEADFGADYRSLQITFEGDKATVGAETSVATTLTAVLGYERLGDEVSSTAEYPRTRYEIVLVLDTTGAMAGSKIAELRKAATSMIDDLTATPELRDRVHLAIVPFAGAVNVGPDMADAEWIDTSGRVYLPNSAVPAKVDRLKVFGNLGAEWKGCVEARVEGIGQDQAFVSNDAEPDPREPGTLFVPLLAPDEPKDAGYDNNYVKDDSLAGLGLDVQSDGNGGYTVAYKPVPDRMKVDGSKLKGGTRGGDPNRGCDARPITPLTDDAALLKKEIGQLQAAGSANITEGVAWGRRVLSPTAPFEEGAAPAEDVRKIVVLLSGADNEIRRLPNPNGSAYSAYGYVADGRWNKSFKADKAKKTCTLKKSGNSGAGLGLQVGGLLSIQLGSDDDDDDDESVGSESCERKAVAAGPAPSEAAIRKAMDADTAEACTQAKATSEVYAVNLIPDGGARSDLLADCATGPQHYYDVRSAADLKGVFDQITRRILRLRITS